MKFLLILSALTLVGCGEMKKGMESVKEMNPLIPPMSPSQQPVPFTPASYFKVVSDVGNAKDTRVYEFQYLSSKKFIVTQTHFPGGNLSTSYYHKRTGTYIEQMGQIVHTPTYDSCNNLAPETIFMSGKKTDVVTINYRGNVLNLYSYGTWSLPTDIANHIPDAVEDIGCVKFKDN